MAHQAKADTIEALPKCMDRIHNAITDLSEEARRTGPGRHPNDADYCVYWEPRRGTMGYSIYQTEEPDRPAGAMILSMGPLIIVRRRIGSVYNGAYQALVSAHGSVKANPDWGA